MTLEKPIVTPPGGGFFSYPFNVTVTIRMDAAQAKYTLDGSTPGLGNGTLLTTFPAVVSIPNPLQLQVVAINGSDLSDVLSYTYTQFTGGEFSGDAASVFDDLAQLACERVGNVNPDAVDIARKSALLRYRNIYNSYPWRFSEIVSAMTVTAPLIGGPGSPTPENTDATPIPDNIDRLTAVKGPNGTLDPITKELAFQLDPAIWSQVGVPQYYSEMWVDGTYSLRLIPNPETDYPLTLIGRQKFSLENSVDAKLVEPLLSFVIADLLEYMKKFGQKNDKIGEGQALVKEAQSIDLSLRGMPRRTKRTTVGGSSMAEMIDSVCMLLGDFTPEKQELARERFKRNYQVAWDTVLWPESTIIGSFNALSGEQVILTPDFGEVIAVAANQGGLMTNQLPLEQQNAQLWFGLNPSLFYQAAGESMAYSTLQPIATRRISPFNEALKLVAGEADVENSATDKPYVTIRGESAGVTIVERIRAVAGTTVQTINSFDTIYTCAKELSSCKLDVVGSSSAITLVTLGPGERERKYPRIMLMPLGGATDQILILGKRAINSFSADEDTPLIPSIVHMLIYQTQADLLEQSDPPKAAAASARASAALQVVVRKATEQRTDNNSIIPYTEPDSILL